MSPACAAAALTELHMIRQRAERIPGALEAAEHLRAALDALGYDVCDNAGPFLPIRFPARLSLAPAQHMLRDRGACTVAVLPGSESRDQLLLVYTDGQTRGVDAVIGTFAYLRRDLLVRNGV